MKVKTESRLQAKAIEQIRGNGKREFGPRRVQFQNIRLNSGLVFVNIRQTEILT